MQKNDVWRPAGPDAIAWRQWDGDVVLYNGATGSTHHLSMLGGEVMLALLRHPSGIAADALVREFMSHVEVGDDVDAGAAVERALVELARLRIAIRASS